MTCPAAKYPTDGYPRAVTGESDALRETIAKIVASVPNLSQEAIEGAAVRVGAYVLDLAAHVPSFQLEPLDFGNGIGFRIINSAHKTPPCLGVYSKP
jgi:hypothetical protein